MYRTAQAAANTEPERKLVWDWSQVNNLRFGKYTAKLVAVYNDGQRDVPIQTELTFWIIPWRILIAALVVTALLLLGLWTLIRRVIKPFKHKKRYAHTKS